MVFQLEQEKKDNPIMFRATNSELRFIRNLMITENKLQSQILRELFSAGLEKLYNNDNTTNSTDDATINELTDRINQLETALNRFFELFFSIPSDRIYLTDSEREILKQILEVAKND